jgi:hypothetical protein
VPDGRAITSEELANLIIDALVDAGLVAKDRINEAVEIATVEIDVRKAAGDYADRTTAASRPRE